jgi:hypothetical protein
MRQTKADPPLRIQMIDSLKELCGGAGDDSGWEISRPGGYTSTNDGLVSRSRNNALAFRPFACSISLGDSKLYWFLHSVFFIASADFLSLGPRVEKEVIEAAGRLHASFSGDPVAPALWSSRGTSFMRWRK